MVVVEGVTELSERRTQTSSEAFPDDALASIRSAVETVPASVFDGSTKHTEVGGFDAAIADGLTQYEYEGDAAGGFNNFAVARSPLPQGAQGFRHPVGSTSE